MFGGGDDLDPDVLRPLANHSLLLLLVLPNQLTKDANKYRGAMFSCKGQKSSVKNQSSKDKGQLFLHLFQLILHWLINFSIT